MQDRDGIAAAPCRPAHAGVALPWPLPADVHRRGAAVDYFSGTTHYAVPASYRPGITRYAEERNYSALTLMLFLPDLSPAADHPEEMRRPGWHDQMTLLFEHGPRWGDPDAQIAIMTNTPRGVHTAPEPAANGCDLYRTPLMVPGDVYACPEDGSKLILSCTRKSDVPYPDCTVFENVSLIYHYSAKYFGDAMSDNSDQHIQTLDGDIAAAQAALEAANTTDAGSLSLSDP